MGHLQAILGDIRLSQRHEEALDNLFGGVQPTALKKLVLAMDNFDQLATHCKQVSTFMLACYTLLGPSYEYLPSLDL